MIKKAFIPAIVPFAQQRTIDLWQPSHAKMPEPVSWRRGRPMQFQQATKFGVALDLGGLQVARRRRIVIAHRRQMITG